VRILTAEADGAESRRERLRDEALIHRSREDHPYGIEIFGTSYTAAVDKDGLDPHLALERGDLIATAVDDYERRAPGGGVKALHEIGYELRAAAEFDHPSDVRA
jgi:hypothetical protein